MRQEGNILYLTISDIIIYGISENVIKNAISRNKEVGVSWQSIKVNGIVHIDFDSIPAATRKKLPLKEQLIKKLTLTNIGQLVQVDLSDLNYFLGSPETHTNAHEYARIAAWLRLCAAEKPTTAREKGFNSVDELYQTAIEMMLTEHFSTWKIENIQVFKRRLKPFNQLLRGKIEVKEALESLVSRKFGKQNAQKLTEEQHDVLIQIHSNGLVKPSFEQTYALYIIKAKEKITAGEWDAKALVSEQTVVNFLKRPDVIQTWYIKRHGLNAWRERYDPVISRTEPSFANALWVMDGTPWHRYYRDGKNAYARLNIFPIIDAHSWMVIGYSVDFAETTEQVCISLLGACRRTGVLPHQLQYDHGSANMSAKAQQAINALAKYNTPTKVGNARAKIIEPFFKQFNEHVLKFRQGYAGSNITAKKLDSHVNREELQLLIKMDGLPTLEEALADMSECFKIWNEVRPFKKTGLTPFAKWQQSMQETADKQRRFTEMMEVEGFWNYPGELRSRRALVEGKIKNEKYFEPTLYTFTNKGIIIVKDKKAYSFDVESVWFRANHIDRKFSVKYDAETMDKLYLFDQNGKPVSDPEGNFIIALPKSKIHMAIADHQDGEAANLHRLLKLKEDQLKLVREAGDKHIQSAKVAGNFTPVTAENLYPKQLINEQKTLQMESAIGDNSLIDAKKKAKVKKETTSFLLQDITEDKTIEIEIPKEKKPEKRKITKWDI